MNSFGICKISDIAICFITAAMATAAVSPTKADDVLRQEANSLFGLVQPATNQEISEARAQLGRRLFFDQRLSKNGDTACASCHTAEAWGSDRRAYSLDAWGKNTERHSQSVFNAMEQRGQRWLADREDGAVQAIRSLAGSMGLGASQNEAEANVAALLSRYYAKEFALAFPGQQQPASAKNYAIALEAYQATLRTPSAFDSWLKGDEQALTEEQKDGLRLFIETGCSACHNGPLFGGNSLQKFGVAKDYWLATGTSTSRIDKGRFALTGKAEDEYVFRVPMLRNVAKTAPYFHDGSVQDLLQAIRVMGDVQLGVELPDDTIKKIATFLETLSGAVPAHFSDSARGSLQ